MKLNPLGDVSSQGPDGLILAFELVLTTTIFAGIGWWLDGRLGTRPVLTIGLGVFTITYEVWKLVTNYGREIAAHEDRRVPLRRGPVE